jgi:predicted phosphodiesterase
VYAIISDIHGNLEALEAVLADIASKNITRIICLGDVIGYGPNPRECIDLAGDFDLVLLGNHEEATLYGAVGFNPKAKAAIDWTREQLNNDPNEPDRAKKRWEFIKSLPTHKMEDKILLVHGSPFEPTREYLFQHDVRDPDKMKKNFDKVKTVAFNGHTHLPGIFSQEKFFSPEECFNVYILGDEKVIINVGSVGQPRDGDFRACYVTIENEIVVFRRVEYDIDKTVEKIQAVKELPSYLGERLREGR